MQIENDLTRLLHLKFPLIMAPMFLVSNEVMVKEAMKAGIMGTFPSLNFRKDGELAQILDNLNAYKQGMGDAKGNYGINLIVQRSNPLYEKHLKIAVEKQVPFYITSLGNPKQVIDAAHSYGAKVFCDVTNVPHAEKCLQAGADGFIAVGLGAGGHAGPFPLSLLVPSLRNAFPNIPVIAAGGIAEGQNILSMLSIGAAGVSVGTRFIASTEATVSNEYKQAIVNYGMGDIVLSTRISGTPCTIIDTPYAKKIGYTQNWLEKFLSNNKTTKKYFKMLVQLRGMQKLEMAVKPGNYDNLWCAGQSVELIHDIKPVGEIVNRLIAETFEAQQTLSSKFVA